MDFVGSSGDATFDTTFYMPHKTVKSFGSHRYGGTAVRFDDYEDLMWTGTKEVRTVVGVAVFVDYR